MAKNPKPKTVEADRWPQGDLKYTNGYCSTFAEVLQQMFGGEVFALVNHSRTCPDPEDDNLLHAYCVIDGVAYDAYGAEPLDEASDTSDLEVPDMDRDMDVVFQWRQVDSAWFAACHEDYISGWKDNEDSEPMIAAMKAYIRRNKKLFGHLKELQAA